MVLASVFSCERVGSSLESNPSREMSFFRITVPQGKGVSPTLKYQRRILSHRSRQAITGTRRWHSLIVIRLTSVSDTMASIQVLMGLAHKRSCKAMVFPRESNGTTAFRLRNISQ